MKLTVEQLKKIMPNAEKNIIANRSFMGYDIKKIVELLNKYAEVFEINTPLRWANYLAQIAHESGEMRYTTELASGEHYEGRRDLGNTHAGDGKKYKGRGLIQLTGRANYSIYKDFCGYDVLEEPELLAKPVGAIRSSMWYWDKHNLNHLADQDLMVAITKKINGGTTGLLNRVKYHKRAKEVLGA